MTYTIISRILNVLLLVITVVSAVLLISENSHGKDYDPGFVHIDQFNHPESKELVHLARQWALVLDDLAGSPVPLSTLFSREDIKLDLVDKRIKNYAELENWVYSRQVRLETSKHSVHNIKIRPKDDGVYLLKFEYHAEETNIDGPHEISRIEQTWRVRIDESKRPLIHEIKESYLAPLINSGSRIQC